MQPKPMYRFGYYAIDANGYVVAQGPVQATGKSNARMEAWDECYAQNLDVDRIEIYPAADVDRA